jgi:hypothetical protein
MRRWNRCVVKIIFPAFPILMIGQRVQDACVESCQEWFIAVFLGIILVFRLSLIIDPLSF